MEEFWSLYNNMHPPTKWVHGSDLYCFKHEIEPKLEDPVSANGGKWTMMFPKAQTTLEFNWLNTLSIGKQWKELLGCNETIGFIFHIEDAKTLDRNAKLRYTV
ncbi:unnamed protein product [Eruca vesicaria subsp. sativa]|uniref:mRNA cap-binding protein n=1 Tax=Eruca vesicaria subsp. sativa TaxID=29727 RepID=A0ABC8JQ19_ERUVS|nr:unnamed protein product [Eruca vesicaria subsp. sativa]